MSDAILKRPKKHSFQNINQTGDTNLIINNAPGVNNNINISRTDIIAYENGKPYVPVTPIRYSKASKVLTIGAQRYQFHNFKEEDFKLSKYDMKYINALYDVYSELSNKSITEENISPEHETHLLAQKKAYFHAESIRRNVRDIFADGDETFNDLIEDGYEGIEPIFMHPDHKSGYDRLTAVLEKITELNLGGSALINLTGLIDNLVKKGLCHIMVSEDKISSWVNNNE